jgi:hypothetical protein
MSENVVINDTTYNGVDALALPRSDGTVAIFYPDAVRYGVQTLTEAQQARARDNIGCIAKNQGSANVGKILVVGTDGNLTLTDMPAGGGDVTGTIDENNNILLSGNLASGTYTLKYENQDGTYTEIGTLEVGVIGGYTNLFSTSGDGFANDTDFSGASSGRFLTNYIPCKDGDVIHVKGATVYKAKAHNSADDVWGSAVYAASLKEAVSDYDDTVKVYTITQATTGVSNIDKVQLEIRSGNTALDSVIITVNQDIVD